MSYILEALRRADQERRLGQAPTLGAVPWSAPPTSPRWPWVAVGILVVLCIGGGFVFAGWGLWNPPSSSRPDASPPTVAAPTSPVAVSAPSPAPPNPLETAALETVVQTAVRTAVETAVKQAMENVAKERPPAERPSERPPRLAVETPPRSVNPHEPPRPPSAVKAAKSSPEKTAPPETPSKPKPTPPGDSTADPKRTTEATSSIPPSRSDGEVFTPAALNLDIHVYSETAAKRFVVINGRRYRAGEQLTEGAWLEAITPQGALLNHQGQRFLLPIHRD